MVEKPTQGTGLVSTLSDKVGVEMKNSNDLMNWIIFGKENKFYNK